MALAKGTKALAREEAVEDLLRRTGVDQDDAVVGPEAEVKPHVRRRDLGEHRLVAAQQLVGVSGEPPDRRVHGREIMPLRGCAKPS
ncbi:MAG: hypothetical protein ACM3QU_01540 [Verrucomicrobiota bacterium]